MQSEMTKLYVKETGKAAWQSWGPPSLTDEDQGYLELYIEAPTCEYIRWLEKHASKGVAQNSASDNTDSQICLCTTVSYLDTQAIIEINENCPRHGDLYKLA